MADNKRRRKSKLRPIDSGTRYDIAGNLKRMGREIEHGKHGEVRDAILSIRELGPGGRVRVVSYHYGTGTFSDALYILESAKNRIT